MVDLISHLPEVFYARKDGVEILPETRARYDALFQTMDCFHVTTSFAPKKHVGNGGVPPHKKSGFFADSKRQHAKHPIVPGKTMIKKINSTEKIHLKKVKCILNVMNKANYGKQINKLKFVIEDQNIEEIIPLIIDTGVMQIFYIDLYINMLRDITQQHVIDNYAVVFAKKFLEERLNRTYMDDTLTEYDRFCLDQKHKTIMVSTGIMIVHLIEAGLFSCDINTFLKDLLSKCDGCNEIISDIVLQILTDAKKSCRSIVGFLRENKATIVNIATCTKLRYTVEELLQE